MTTRRQYISESKTDDSAWHREKLKFNDKTSIEYILGNPVCCGFLLKFCESEHNAENLNFIMAVDRFRDAIRSVDKRTWKKTWRELDNTLLLNENEGESLLSIPSIDTLLFDPSVPWQSHLDRSVFAKKASKIWNLFMSPNAPKQICISHEVMCRTLLRIRSFHVYGPEIFEEALLDPIKTMRCHVLPRFLLSRTYTIMVDRIMSCEPPPTARDFEEAHLSGSCYCSSTKEVLKLSDYHNFELIDFLQYDFLFRNFLSYLRPLFSAENLLCILSIDKYECMAKHCSASEAVDQAWEVYRYFIAPGAAYEVSLQHLQYKDIMLNMADCKPGMFDAARTSALQSLENHFSEFRTTSNYLNLSKSMKQDFVKTKSKQRQIPGFGSCFPVYS